MDRGRPPEPYASFRTVDNHYIVTNTPLPAIGMLSAFSARPEPQTTPHEDIPPVAPQTRMVNEAPFVEPAVAGCG